MLSNKPTVIVSKYEQSAKNDIIAEGNSYNGLRIHTLPGLHEHLAELIRIHVRNYGQAFDLGAGSGALSSRLRDMGFSPTAVDYVAENFRLHEKIPFIRADLNGQYSDVIDNQADLVTAIEIVEHLENPRHFLRQAIKLCKPNGGKIILTTPNLDNPVSKAFFCRFGHHMWFSDKDYLEQGHITPLSRWQIHKIAEEIGLEILHEGSFGDPFLKLSRWPKLRLFSQVIRHISFCKPELSGEIYIAVLAPK